MGGPFFALGKELLEQMNVLTITHPKLEADDCNAILSKYIPIPSILGMINLKTKTPRKPEIIAAIAPLSEKSFQNKVRIIVGQKLAAIP